MRFVLVVKVESGTDNAIDGVERQERDQRPRGMARSLRLGVRVTKWQGGRLTFTLISIKSHTGLIGIVQCIETRYTMERIATRSFPGMHVQEK